MPNRKLSKKKFQEQLKIVSNQNYPKVQYLDPDAIIADYLKKKRLLNKGEVLRETSP